MSTLFLNTSLLQLGLPCYQFFLYIVGSYSIIYFNITTWTLTKRMEKKLDGNYTRMLRAILNKSRRQHPTKQQLYGHLPPITKTIKVRRTRHAGHCWRNKDELISGPLHMAEQRQYDQLEPTYRSSVLIRDVAPKTCRKQWTIEEGDEKGTWRSVRDMMMMMMIYDGLSFWFKLMMVRHFY